MGALKFLDKRMTVKQGKKLVDGVIMSRALYGITVWGNMVLRTQVGRVQTIQTVALRWIVGEGCGSKDGRYLNRKELLKAVG